MRLRSITARNFRLHADTHVSLPDGVIGIIGSNESGKSTLLEVVAWCLFGGRAVRGTKSGLLWHGARAGEKVQAETEFVTAAGESYRIERTETDAKLRRIETDEIIAQGTSAVNDAAPALIGMTYDEFITSHFVMQKDVARIASMLPTERQAFIRQVMGVGRIDDALKDCRKGKAALAEELRGMEAMLGPREPLVRAIDDAAGEVATWEESLAAAQKVRREARENAEEAKEEYEALHEVYERRQNLLREGERLHETKASAGAEILRLHQTMESIEAAGIRIAEAEKELVDLPLLKKRRDMLREAKAALSERATLTERAVEIREALRLDRDTVEDAKRQIGYYDAEKHEAANQRAGEADKRLAELRDERRSRRTKAEAKVVALTAEIEKADTVVTRLRAMGTEAPCPVCTRALGDDLDRVVQDLLDMASEKDAERIAAESVMEAARNPSNKEIDAEMEREGAEAELEKWATLAKDADRAKDVIAIRTVAIEKLEAEQEKVSARLAALPTVDFDASDLRATEDRIQVLENLDRGLVSARGLVAQAESVHADLDRWTGVHDDAERDSAKVAAELEALAFDAEAYQQARAHVTRTKAALDEARIAVARSEETLNAKGEVQRKAHQALDDHDEKAARVDAVRERHTLHEKVDARLSAFRVAIAATIRPEMEELVSGFVSLLTDGRHESVEIGEDFSVTLHEDGQPVEVVSGGTEDIAALSMRLAISHMISERAGTPIQFLAMDEPFGSLDEVRRAAVVNLVRELRRSFPQVITMSHIAETREMVDHAIELEYDDAAQRTRVTS